jgi:hypothetical protein
MPRAKTPRTITPPKKQVLTMPEATSTAQVRKASSSANSQNLDLDAQIRQRAYELYQERGCTPGHENEDWLQAEAQVLDRQNRKQSA